MTREEAINNLNMISVAFVEPVTKEQRRLIDDTFDMAIKALEQQPNRCDSCVHSEEQDGSNCYECVKGITDNFELMRDATEEERKSVKDYVESISKPTGVHFDETQPTDADCISRESVREKFKWLEKATKYGNEDAEQQNFSYSTMMMYEIKDMIDDAIDSLPSVTPQPKVGKWIAQDIHNCHTDFKCSECGYIHSFTHLYGEPTADYTYCPRCGAKMEVAE